MNEKLDMQSPNWAHKNTEFIAQHFPNCVTETADGLKIDFDLLKQELSPDLIEGNKERYRLEWPGKRQAIVTANLPTQNTLRPVREDSVNFDTTENLYIEGDNLEVLKLLQESYLNKIKMIYIDPPYNTGKDFVYRDNFRQDAKTYKNESGQTDDDGNRLRPNPETSGRYHSDWLSMMYPRLKLARNLLREDGVIFISIDDNEVHNLRKVCDEIFGEGNFIGLFIINSSPSAIDYGHIAKSHDYALFYAKDFSNAITFHLEDKEKKFKYTDEKGAFNIYPLYNGNVAFNPQTRPNLFYPFYLNPNNQIDEDFYEIGLEKKEDWVEVYPVVSQKDNIQRVWRWGKPKAKSGLNNEIIGYKSNTGEFRIVQKTRLTGKMIRSLQLDTQISSRRGTSEIEELFGGKIFTFPKPIELIRRFIEISTSKSDLILDFFSGAGVTSHSVFRINSVSTKNIKFIQVQLPEPTDPKSEAHKAGYPNICEIGKERIRRAGKAILKEQEQKITELESKISTLQNKIDKAKKGNAFPDDDPKIKTFTEEQNNLQKEIAQIREKMEGLDIGFRVYRLDSSNMKEVYYKPHEYDQSQLVMFKDNVKADRGADDLLAQIMLDWGLPLSLPIEQAEIAGKRVFKVAGNSLYACFEEGIGKEFAREVAKERPLRMVFRDSSFAKDEDKTNVQQLLRQLSGETEMRVI